MTSELLDALYAAIRPLLFRLDAERAHELTVSALSTLANRQSTASVLGRIAPRPDPRMAVRTLGMSFPSPIGMAAGFDKNATAFPALLALGFGAVEVGTITPLPQGGNPPPRLYRLAEDSALINRLGFPGHGVEAAVNSLVRLRQPGRIVGCNIGPNRESVKTDRLVDDYVSTYHRVAPYCSYVTINVSSPNTPGLRAVHESGKLGEILTAINQERLRTVRRPLLIKISPDLTQAELAALLDVAFRHRVDGIVAANTTTSRPVNVHSKMACQSGGLSGRPLSGLVLETVRFLYRQSNGQLPIIASGGIFTGRDVLGAISIGASLVQTYTGFVFRGPAFPSLVQNEITELLDRWGVDSIEALRGRRLPEEPTRL